VISASVLVSEKRVNRLTYVSVSFDAWPKPGQLTMSSAADEAYAAALKGKTYMMGVSPYFYTSKLSPPPCPSSLTHPFPDIHILSKNWYSSSASL